MKTDLRNTDMVKRALQEAEHWLTVGVRTDLGEWCEENDDETEKYESPIEAVFALWWQAASMASTLQGFSEGLGLDPQTEVVIEERHYRLDFSVRPADPDDLWDNQRLGLGIHEPLIAVELDGHEFHERTRDQVVSRNQRDRDLQIVGWKVFHFSGSEVHREALTCVTRVLSYAQGEWAAFRRAVRSARRAKGLVD